MRWQVKAGIQSVLSVLPRGEEVNYLLQRRVMGSFPVTDAYLLSHADEAFKHLAAFEAHGSRPVPAAHAYEFGAGQHLIGPVVFWMAGVERQTIVDISAIMRWEIVSDTVDRLAGMHATLEEHAGRPLRRPDPDAVGSHAELRERFGIDYRAPLDARDTGLEPGSVDLITSTYTLEHIPRDDIALILRECARLLADDGLVSCNVDLADHYSFVDESISAYNFLRYSDRAWRVVNSSLHFQNRLRARDHLELFDGAGLSVTGSSTGEPEPRHVAALADLPVAPRFRERYTDAELVPTSIELTAVKPA